MANVIFYSTGEIFWVSDPPPNRREHIGIPLVWPAVPPDDFFTYARCAHALQEGGHTVIGAYGRQRMEVRNAFETGGASGAFTGDPEFLALAGLPAPEKTVIVLITTETGTAAEGGVDHYPRIPFTHREAEAFRSFRARGGGVYVTWDHGQLGYDSLKSLGLEGPVEPEPDEPFRPNTAHSNDSTDSAKIVVKGRRLTQPEGHVIEDVGLSVGPPAGYLQKIVPAQLLYRDNGVPAPVTPHPIFNGVGGEDGLWIPAHMHEGKLKVDIIQLQMDETKLPLGVKTLAVHIPLNETSFNSFAVMAYQDHRFRRDGNGEVVFKGGRPVLEEGAIVWDTSFHHLSDINWSSDGNVPWEAYVSFSAEGLWQQQFPPELFETRMEQGMKRLFVNAISWIAQDLPYPPRLQAQQYAAAAAGSALSGAGSREWKMMQEPQAETPSEDSVPLF